MSFFKPSFRQSVYIAFACGTGQSVGRALYNGYEKSHIQCTEAEKKVIAWKKNGDQYEFSGPVDAQEEHKLLRGKTFTSPDGNKQVRVLTRRDDASPELLMRTLRPNPVYLPNALFGSLFRVVDSEKILCADGSTKFYAEMKHRIFRQRTAVCNGQTEFRNVENILHYAEFIDFCDEDAAERDSMLSRSLLRCNSLSWIPWSTSASPSAKGNEAKTTHEKRQGSHE